MQETQASPPSSMVKQSTHLLPSLSIAYQVITYEGISTRPPANNGSSKLTDSRRTATSSRPARLVTDKEGEVVGDPEVRGVVRQPVVDDRVRHPVERQDEELLADVRVPDQVHRRGRRRRRPVLGLDRLGLARIGAVARNPLPPEDLQLKRSRGCRRARFRSRRDRRLPPFFSGNCSAPFSR